MIKDFPFAVIGGDLRQIRLAGLLAREGYKTTVFAQERVSPEPPAATADTLHDALQNSRCTVLPLPCLASDGYLNTPLSDEKIMPEQIFGSLPQGSTAFCGLADNSLKSLARQHGVELLDYAAQEEFSILNAISTAEGAIQIAMEEMPITLHGAQCLVIGFGRLGKVICADLKALGAHVTAAARKCRDRAWIKTYSYTPACTADLVPSLPRFDLIINTVPALILDHKALSVIRSDCLCIDLASKPGGIDFSQARILGVKCIWALSLPGKVAPYSAALIVRDTIFNMLTERDDFL